MFEARTHNKVFAIAGQDERAIGSGNINQLQFGGRLNSVRLLFVPSTLVFQSAFVPTAVVGGPTNHSKGKFVQWSMQ